MTRATAVRIIAILMTGAAAGGGVAGATTPGGAPTPSALTVVAVAPPAWPAQTGFDIDVAVRNASHDLLCGPVDVTLTWRSAQGPAHSEMSTSANTGGSATAALPVPAATVRPGALRYSVTAIQRCGWLDGTTTYVGRSPTKGWSTVSVFG